MSVSKLMTLFDDVKHSIRFANTHLNIGMPGWLEKHAKVNRSTLSRLRDTDADASRLAEFRHSIRNNSMDRHNRSTGEDDYARMVDILIRHSKIIQPYAGPRDFKDWAELKNLKKQFRDFLQNPFGKDQYDDYLASNFWGNPGFAGIRSILTTAHMQAVSDVQATIGEEVTPAIADALLEGVLDQYNEVAVEFNGETVTMQDMKDYAGRAGDGMMSAPDVQMSQDGWN